MVNVSRSKILGVLLLTTLAIPVFAQRDITRRDGPPDFMKTILSADLAPRSAIISDCRSPMRRVCSGRYWDASLLTLPEHQCKPHPSDYGRVVRPTYASGKKSTPTQQLIAYHTHISWQAPDAPSGWMAARIRPSMPRTPGRVSPPASGKATC